MIKVWFGAALAWAAMSVGALAQAPPSEERLALAREVMVLAGGEASFTGMINAMRPLTEQQLRSHGLSEEAVQRAWAIMVEEFVKEAPQFVELGAIAYANAFTDEELRGMAEFFRSPAGRAMVAHQTEIATAMAHAGMIIGRDVGLRVAARLEDEPERHAP